MATDWVGAFREFALCERSAAEVKAWEIADQAQSALSMIPHQLPEVVIARDEELLFLLDQYLDTRLDQLAVEYTTAFIRKLK